MNFVFKTIDDYNEFVKSSATCFISNFCNFICYDNTLEQFKKSYILEKNISLDFLYDDPYFKDKAYIILKSQVIFNPEFTKDYKFIKNFYNIFKKQLTKTLKNCINSETLINKNDVIKKLFDSIYSNYIKIEIEQFKTNNSYYKYAEKIFTEYYYTIIKNFINTKLNEIYIDILDIYNTYYLSNMTI